MLQCSKGCVLSPVREWLLLLMGVRTVLEPRMHCAGDLIRVFWDGRVERFAAVGVFLLCRGVIYAISMLQSLSCE